MSKTIFFRSGIISLCTVLIVTAFWPAPLLHYLKAFLLLLLGFTSIEMLLYGFYGELYYKPWSYKKIARNLFYIALVFLCLVSVKTLWAGAMLPEKDYLFSQKIDPDTKARRNYLIYKVGNKDFGPHDMPSIIESPFREELAIACLSMTTTALTNIAFQYPETVDEAKGVIEEMIETMLTPQIRRYEVLWWGHDALTNLENGQGQIGYLGHLNLMLGAYRLLGGSKKYDELHHSVTRELKRRLLESPGFHAETFPGLTFTADNTLVYTSLKHYDTIFIPENKELIQKWIRYTRKNLVDKESGMVRYYVNRDGEATGTPRGVLQAWNSMWLPHIDQDFASEQYLLMKKNLRDLTTIGKLGGVREYPKGVTGPTDLIAGPIIFGVSASATGFALGGARWWNDHEFLNELLLTAEFIGSSVELEKKRFYLFSPLVGDAVVLAAKTMQKWDARFILDKKAVESDSFPE